MSIKSLDIFYRFVFKGNSIASDHKHIQQYRYRMVRHYRRPDKDKHKGIRSHSDDGLEHTTSRGTDVMNLFKTPALLLILILVIPLASHAECIDVARAQRILKTMNYYPDPVSGTLTAETMKSISIFQSDHNLRPTGTLDPSTCKALLAEEEKLSGSKERKKREKDVLEAQKQLKILKYYDGPEDGIASAPFKKSLLDFQAANRLSGTGWLDIPTTKTLFGPTPVPKPNPTPPPAIKAKAPAPPEKADSNDNRLFVVYSGGYTRYRPKSSYDPKTYDAVHNTLHPEQDVSFKSESFMMNRITLGYGEFQGSYATSRLDSGDNTFDAADFTWYFKTGKTPWILNLSFENADSDAEYAGMVKQINTLTFEAELLYRSKPWMAWGISGSYANYPTLVSCRNENSQLQDIRFDRHFTLYTLNWTMRYDSLAQFNTPLIGTKTVFPFVSGSLHAGLSSGKASHDVISAMNTDLGHSFPSTTWGINLKFSPQAGLKYIHHGSNVDMEFTLGYGLYVDWPMWSIWTLPGMSKDDHVDFYRHTVSHGPIIGGNVAF
jgi:hypothetical protein